MEEVGGTNPLMVPGVKKLGGPVPPGPHGCCAYDRECIPVVDNGTLIQRCRRYAGLRSR